MFSYKKNNLLPILATNSRRSDNSSVILFTNARDEPNIAEWVAHHLLLGFDKIVVFDHLSKNPISSVLMNDFNKRLKVIRTDGCGNIKLKLIQTALEIAINGNYSWMLYLDADEFLNLNKFNNVKSLLSVFGEADSIGVNWLMFGTSGFKSQPSGLITENFIRSELRLNSHVKTFVRPSAVVRAEHPHFFIMINPSRCYSINGTKMKMGPFNNQPIPFIKAVGYIAHYYTQSEDEHMRRKSRQLDDGSVNKSAMIPKVHSVYNNFANNQLQNKYSQKIKEFLKDHNIFL
jgi:hypothetical protein